MNLVDHPLVLLVFDHGEMDALEDGQNIHFSMIETEKNKWVIDQIHVMSSATDKEGVGND